MSSRRLRAAGSIFLVAILPVAFATSSIKPSHNISDFVISICVGLGLSSFVASIQTAPWRKWMLPIVLMAIFISGATGCGFWLYRIEQDHRSKALEPHVAVGTKTYHWDYPATTNLDGITWKQGYAFSRILFYNQTGHDFTNLDIRIRPEHPIIKGKIMDGINDCKFGPFISPTQSSDFTILAKPVGSDKYQVAGIISGEAEHIDETYRLFCQRFAPRSDAEILIATVIDRDIDSVGPLYEPVRKNPLYVDLDINFESDGISHSQNLRAAFPPPPVESASTTVQPTPVSPPRN